MSVRPLPSSALMVCAALALVALGGCAGSSGYAGGNDPALGRSGSSLGIGSASGNGVQLYGVADVSVGRSKTTITSGGVTTTTTSTRWP